ncbi:IS1 family transposase [Aeromonas veronii]|nr:IS1 family transposase [Aeromonas veronii]
MDTNRFFELLRSFTQLTSLQLERAQEHLRYHMQQDLLLQVLTERQTALPVCPHCHAQKVIHWGQSRGLLRYRCKECGKTFNQLHGAALARLRHKEKWALYGPC